MRIIVTGGSGKLGLETCRQLVARGHEVINLDQNRPAETLCRFMHVDFTDYGQVLECLAPVNRVWSEVDAVAHLAAIPGPSQAPGAMLFHNNTLSSFNVFWAAKSVGITNIVWASSETMTGIPFLTPPPYLPIDEDAPRRPESSYALSKLLDEVMAEEFCRWNPGLKMIGLRLSFVKHPAEYPAFAQLQDDARRQSWNLWSYIDVRDGAQAVVRALERDTKGLEIYLIAAADTVMERPTADLVAECFPGAAIRGALERHQSLLSTARAQQVLGWKPQHTWRQP